MGLKEDGDVWYSESVETRCTICVETVYVRRCCRSHHPTCSMTGQANASLHTAMKTETRNTKAGKTNDNTKKLQISKPTKLKQPIKIIDCILLKKEQNSAVQKMLNVR